MPYQELVGCGNNNRYHAVHNLVVASMIVVCCGTEYYVCGKAKVNGEWKSNHLVPRGTSVSHGICPECYAMWDVQFEIEKNLDELAKKMERVYTS